MSADSKCLVGVLIFGAEFHVVIPKISAFSFIEGRGGGATLVPFLSRNLG